MKRNSILIDSSYEFLNSDLIENAVIVIDEFDATKDTIQSELIEKSLAMQEDYIQLFRQIYRTLNPNDFSSSMRQAMDEVEKSGNISTILKRLELTNKQRDLLMGETCQMVRNNRELILEDRSFYQVGMEYYEFEDNDSHHDNTNLKFVKVYDTPEKIMLYLAGKATVFGISATAEVDTVVGNYNLRYLKEQLKERYHKTPGYLKQCAFLIEMKIFNQCCTWEWHCRRRTIPAWMKVFYNSYLNIPR